MPVKQWLPVLDLRPRPNHLAEDFAALEEALKAQWDNYRLTPRYLVMNSVEYNKLQAAMENRQTTLIINKQLEGIIRS